jgi:hydroxymethylpyrimidine/phosphomethylpyrimidine kinase
MTIPVALTIAGSDPSGGAGLQADLKTFHQHRVYGTSVVTLLTVQNTLAVDAVRVLEPSFVLAQLDALLPDIPPMAAKTGALGSAEVVEAVADRIAASAFPVVVDPVMISTHGARLIDADAEQAVATRLLPGAFLATPNLREAAALAAREVSDLASMEDAARRIADLGAKHVLVKGGHLEGRAIDVLWADRQIHRFESDRVETRHTHGTGCVYSAAMTARLAQGDDIITAVGRAKAFIASAIATNPGLGSGFGPTNMMVDVD